MNIKYPSCHTPFGKPSFNGASSAIVQNLKMYFLRQGQFPSAGHKASLQGLEQKNDQGRLTLCAADQYTLSSFLPFPVDLQDAKPYNANDNKFLSINRAGTLNFAVCLRN